MRPETLDAIRSNPLHFLSSECALALGAFLFGYKNANSRASPMFKRMDDVVGGPDQADACTRAYLTSGDTRHALKRLLEVLADLVTQEALAPDTHDQSSPVENFVAIVRDPIQQGRPALVLAEPSMTWLADFANGYIDGVRDCDTRVGSIQEKELQAFGTWLRNHYGGLDAPWYGLIRVHEGACERGLRRFVELWDEFRK